MDAKGFHHGYLGLTIMLASLLAILFTKLRPEVCDFTAVLGFAIFMDDYIQHRRQRSEPGYRSPLNRLYSKIYWKFSWIRSLNRFFDRIFGK